MAKDSFVHLHVHSHYSLLDGACRIHGDSQRGTRGLVDLAKEFRMPALALTDHGNLFGAIDFYSKALEAGVKPIMGYEAYLAPGSLSEKKRGQGKSLAHLTLLACDSAGYRNLILLSTIAFRDGFYYKPRLDHEVLRRHSRGLIGLSGCMNSEMSRRILAGRPEEARATADLYRSIFGKESFYLELQDHGIKEQKGLLEEMGRIHRELELPVVATNDVHYLTSQDARAHDALLCIATGKKLSDQNRLRFNSDQLYFKSPREMASLFGAWPEALRNTLELADRCNVKLDLDTRHLPYFAPPEGLSQEEYLRQLCEEGLRRRYEVLNEELRRRLDHELETIFRMGFAGYFLIVWDFIRFARQNDIPVGPGRGSAAGSLVAYTLGITDLDPLRYDLLFERFLNPGRNELPDIDIDFCQESRERVIEYVKGKYGRENVSQIITFGSLKARAVVRDVARVLELPFDETDRIAKKIPFDPRMTLAKAMEQEKELQELYQTDPRCRELFDIAKRLEGLNRHASKHAAGVVIADRPLVEYVPLYLVEGVETTQHAMEELQQIGLLKVDFLGLQTLTVLRRACDLIEQTTGRKPELDRISLDDPATYELLQRGATQGVFQLESGGMRDLLQKLKPDHFEDVIALLALYRPGPLRAGVVDDFVKRKHGQEAIEYLHPTLESLLQSTNGIILYQEQVMRISNTVGGLDLGEADSLRKAMGKKKIRLLGSYREKFVEGAVERGVKKELAEKIFDQMEFFAGYGFNKSHSTAYALLSYRTAYLKANHVTEYMAALLSAWRGNADKVADYLDECQRLGLKVLPPDVNRSGADFTVEVDGEAGESQPSGPSTAPRGKIRFGLEAVKGIGKKAVAAILGAVSEEGPFPSLFNFCERVDLRAVDKRVMESLVKCGAFDSLGARRSQLAAALDAAMAMGHSSQHDRRVGQLSLLESSALAPVEPELPELPEWPEEERMALEKASLGFYVTNHPLARDEKLLADFSTEHTSNLRALVENAPITIGGMIAQLRWQLMRSGRQAGKKAAFLKFRDLHGTCDAVVFPREAEQYKPLLKADRKLFLRGRVNLHREEPSIKVSEVIPLERARELLSRTVVIRLTATGMEREQLRGLREVLRSHPGTLPVFMELRLPDGQRVALKTGSDYRVSASDGLVRDLDEALAGGSVDFLGDG